MINLNQAGAINGLAVSLVLVIVLLIGAIGFGAWAFAGRQDYKNNVEPKIAAAVKIAKQQEASLKDKQFAEAEKNPLKTYNGPQADGSIVLQYPKTWSGYVTGSSDGNDDSLEGYFYPGVVPNANDQSSAFALRFQVLNQPYSQVVESLASRQQSDSPPTVTPYALPKVPQAVGVKVSGTLPDNSEKTGTMVILPLRGQTLQVWTDGNQFLGDFENIILPNLVFSP